MQPSVVQLSREVSVHLSAHDAIDLPHEAQAYLDSTEWPPSEELTAVLGHPDLQECDMSPCFKADLLGTYADELLALDVHAPCVASDCHWWLVPLALASLLAAPSLMSSQKSSAQPLDQRLCSGRLLWHVEICILAGFPLAPSTAHI